MKDYLVRGLVNSKNCRVFACTTTNLTNVAQQNHNLWPCASAALGRMMAVTLMMGAMNKNKEKMIPLTEEEKVVTLLLGPEFSIQLLEINLPLVFLEMIHQDHRSVDT